MANWTKLIDMAMTPEELAEQSGMIAPALMDKEGPQYPYGLRISLTHDDLAKLNLEPNCDIGDVIDLRAFAVVTSKSMNDGPDGPCCRVELQIQKLSVEDENTESEDD